MLAEAGRVCLLEATGVPGEPLRLLQEVVDAQARFEFLRIAVGPRFEGPLHLEIDRRLDLHRAVLEWRVLAAIPPVAASAPQAAASFAQAPQGAGTPPARKPLL